MIVASRRPYATKSPVKGASPRPEPPIPLSLSLLICASLRLLRRRLLPGQFALTTAPASNLARTSTAPASSAVTAGHPLTVVYTGFNISRRLYHVLTPATGLQDTLCSGGSDQVVRVWDLQRKHCIKWLKGHTGLISGAMYNCKDEHLASVSISGEIIVHNHASGARAAELKDPHGQVLRVLDYSRLSRHVLGTAGDDGSLHLWDITGRSPKASWLKQHSAPATGLCFSSSNDKIIASVGLDKKLYTFDSGTRKFTFCISYEAPFSSLAFREDGWILAAGTSNGRVVFYDVRGNPQPFTVLRAYGNSEAVTALCWQRLRPIAANERNCVAEVALLGGAVEESVLMPDPLPSATLSNVSQTATVRSSSPAESSSFTATVGEPRIDLSSGETPRRNSLVTGEKYCQGCMQLELTTSRMIWKCFRHLWMFTLLLPHLINSEMSLLNPKKISQYLPRLPRFLI